MTKQELADTYKISSSTLRVLLNVRYYNILAEIGYKKEMNIIPPIVVRKFIEIYGAPLNENEIQ